MDGYTPSVPVGKRLDFGSEEFQNLENRGGIEGMPTGVISFLFSGLIEAGKSVYVLVAGGLGERLGYSGIKIALPCETARNASFLQLYIESILAIQSKTRERDGSEIQLPFVLMTSDDTHARTVEFLEAHNYFGMDKNQVTI